MQSYSTDQPLHSQSQSINSLFVIQKKPSPVTIHVKINMVLSIPI